MTGKQARDEANAFNWLKHKNDIEEIYRRVESTAAVGEYEIIIKMKMPIDLRRVLAEEGFATTATNDNGYSTISW